MAINERELTTKLMACHSMSNLSSLQNVIKELPHSIQTLIDLNADTILQKVRAVVRAVISANALDELIEIVKFYEGNGATTQFKELEAYVKQGQGMYTLPPSAPSGSYAPNSMQMQQNYQDAPRQNFGSYQSQAHGLDQQPLQTQPVYEAPPAWGQPTGQVKEVGGLPFIGLGTAILVLIAAVVTFVVLGSGSSDLPAPPNSTKLEINISDITKLPQNSGLNNSGVKVMAYKTKETPQDLVNFYKNEMTDKGWKEGNNTLTGGNSGLILLTRHSQSAEVVAWTLTSQTEIDSLVASIPSLKNKLQPGDTLVVITQGPTSAIIRTANQKVEDIGDLPAPRNSTKLDLTVADLAKLPGNSNLNTNGIKVAAYKTKEMPEDLINFYRSEMTSKGWKEDTNTRVDSGVGHILLTKYNQSAQVVALTLTSQQQIDALATSIPPLKDKLQAGDTLVLVAQGPTNALATPGA